jgi:hypothetical protein
VSKSDFIDWKRNPVTQQVFSMLQARVEQLKDEIVTQAQHGNITTQAYKAGAVDAYNDMLLTEFEESQ